MGSEIGQRPKIVEGEGGCLDAPVPSSSAPSENGQRVVRGVTHRSDCEMAHLGGDYRCDGECVTTGSDLERSGPLSKPQPGDDCPWHGPDTSCRYCKHTHEGPPSRGQYTAGCRHFACREANRRYAAAWREAQQADPSRRPPALPR